MSSGKRRRFPSYHKNNDLESGGDDWLPPDDELFARTKMWSNFFSKYSVKEDESLALDLTNDCIDELLGNDEENSESSESVASADFVDAEEEEDPNFDMEKVFNQTMKVIEKRKKNWGRSGFDKLMDTSFCKIEHSKKVDNWLDGNSRYLPKENYKFRGDRRISCPDKIEIRNCRVYVERSSSPDSDASVDTIKYILSNKKKQKTHYRRMSIKEFCYSRRRKEEQEQCCRKTVPKTYQERFSDFIQRKPTSFSSRYSCVARNYRSHRRSEPDSSSSSDSRSEGAGRFRRSKIPKMYKKLSVSREISPFDSHSETQNSDITFAPENVVNSTVISKLSSSASAPRNDFQHIQEENEITTVGNYTEVNGNGKTESSSEPKKKSPTSNPIVIYTPEDTSKNFESSITNGKILLTSKMLEDSIGPKLANIYLNMNENFSREFDQHSKILFYPPEANVVTSDSETDILDCMSSNTKGRIVEILNSI